MASSSKKLAFMAVLVVLVLLFVSAAADIPAVMTENGFGPHESGGGPSECDGQYHDDNQMLAALSTRWYAGGARCFKWIRITSTQTGRCALAQVVDECDSRRGCKNNIVDTSKAVWAALGLDVNVGVVPVTWSDA